MKIKSKKGFALAMAIMFLIILMISSIGLYLSTEFLAKETRGQEIEYIRGYYAAMAGLRYAYILLRDPGNISYLTDNTTVDNAAYPAFFTDIGVDRLTITITRSYNAPGGPYSVSATYSY